jgi:hypothetical protein
MWLIIGVSYPLSYMQRTKSVLLLQYETYLNRTSWGAAFGFGIDAVQFTRVEKHPSLKYIYE